MMGPQTFKTAYDDIIAAIQANRQANLTYQSTMKALADRKKDELNRAEVSKSSALNLIAQGLLNVNRELEKGRSEVRGVGVSDTDSVVVVAPQATVAATATSEYAFEQMEQAIQRAQSANSALWDAGRQYYQVLEMKERWHQRLLILIIVGGLVLLAFGALLYTGIIKLPSISQSTVGAENTEPTAPSSTQDGAGAGVILKPTPSQVATPTQTDTASVTPTAPAPTPTLSPVVASTRYRVINIANGGSLNVRAGAGVNNEVVGQIPYNAVDIEITGSSTDVDNAEWVPIEYGQIKGWVNRKFLAEQSESGLGNPSTVVVSALVEAPTVIVAPEPETTSSATDQPSAEPQNQQIAFASNREGSEQSHIYVMNADGTNQRKLTSVPVYNLFPAWSPEGDRIAYMSGPNPGCSTFVPAGDIIVMNADGSNQTPLTSRLCARWPRWSPDGSFIAYADHSGEPGKEASGYDIYIVSVAGGSPIRITHSPGFDGYPAWAPDGRIIYSCERPNDGTVQLCLVDTDGSHIEVLTSGAGQRWTASYSPDGARIAYASDSSGAWKIWTMDADGTAPVQLTQGAGVDKYPSWSPDGAWLAFHSNKDDESNYEIYVMPSTGGKAQRITNVPKYDDEAAWRPIR